ncbi:putative endopeptidase [Alteromonadaceae bacterium 2753L.S.0a.02]|nr:putative endopeptidase [Alteromonadaceae bacterium 2753L.S.0a.02]
MAALVAINPETDGAIVAMCEYVTDRYRSASYHSPGLNPASGAHMKKLLVLACLTMLSACGTKESAPLTNNSGIDLSKMDTSIRPQDDFYLYANGTWLKNTEIPADKVRIGNFDTLRDKVDEEVRVIIEQAADNSSAKVGSPDQKVGGLYASFMDVATLNELGIQPLEKYLKRIESISSHADIAAYMGETTHLEVTAPFSLGVIEDFKDPTRYQVFLVQDGLGLPNRDYYYDDSEKGLSYIAAYKAYAAAMFEVLGNPEPQATAEAVYGLEKQLAKFQRNPVENRQYDRWDNKYDLTKLNTLMADFNWPAYVSEAAIESQPNVSAAQPEYFQALNGIIENTPVALWRDYFKLRMLADSATLLSEDIYAIQFEFYNKTLRGQEQPLPRWQRGVSLVNASLGELVGQIYVKEHFPPEYKARMMTLVDNLVASYGESIREIDWMSDATKQKALQKLANFLPKVGYPDTWKSYDTVSINDSLLQNVANATRWNHDYELQKLGRPADRREWGMTPQVVNAYYHPIQNTINFPAAILQPPFFNMTADDAVNYGAIGMVIGHELGHGFDDQGSKFNGDGKLENWWTDEDRAAFEKLTGKLIAQYNAFEPLPGLHVNGELTQGENIGDLAGVSIAYKAYKKSLHGKQAPVIDGLTGDQRFFLGAAQAFLGKYRDEALRDQIKTDPHSPSRYRVEGVVQNVDAFYDAFNVAAGDRHYLPPEERVRIW